MQGLFVALVFGLVGCYLFGFSFFVGVLHRVASLLGLVLVLLLLLCILWLMFWLGGLLFDF